MLGYAFWNCRLTNSQGQSRSPLDWGPLPQHLLAAPSLPDRAPAENRTVQNYLSGHLRPAAGTSIRARWPPRSLAGHALKIHPESKVLIPLPLVRCLGLKCHLRPRQVIFRGSHYLSVLLGFVRFWYNLQWDRIHTWRNVTLISVIDTEDRNVSTLIQRNSIQNE